MIFRCMTNMLEYQSVDVLADMFSSFFLALPDLRCWIQNKEHAASNLCRCRCTRNRTPSTTLPKWTGMPKPCHIPFLKKTVPSVSTVIGVFQSWLSNESCELLFHCLTSSYLFIHFELINNSPIDIMVPLAPKPSDAVALQAISQCGDLPRSCTMLYPFWLESS